jgi:hypothetical protein
MVGNHLYSLMTHNRGQKWRPGRNAATQGQSTTGQRRVVGLDTFGIVPLNQNPKLQPCVSQDDSKPIRSALAIDCAESSQRPHLINLRTVQDYLRLHFLGASMDGPILHSPTRDLSSPPLPSSATKRSSMGDAPRWPPIAHQRSYEVGRRRLSSLVPLLTLLRLIWHR